MNTALAENRETLPAATLTKTDPNAPAFFVRDRKHLFVKAGTVISIEGRVLRFDDDTECSIGDLVIGADYFLAVAGDLIVSVPATSDLLRDAKLVGGFHYAPGGNAEARTGGDGVPAINPYSIWDLNFRPSCPDPRGMTLIEARHGKFWCDIYFCGTRPFEDGSSRFGATIADGDDRPLKADGKKYRDFSWHTATEIYTALGKTLLGPEDFFAAAYGVTEKTSLGDDPKTCGLDASRTSRYGVMQATGNMSTWGTDGDPDGNGRACRFGGVWGSGSNAGSRFAGVGYWPGFSPGWVSARGRSDHLQPA